MIYIYNINDVIYIMYVLLNNIVNIIDNYVILNNIVHVIKNIIYNIIDTFNNEKNICVIQATFNQKK